MLRIRLPPPWLAWLCWQRPGLHVGGRTALDWQGVRHFVALRPRLILGRGAHHPAALGGRRLCLYLPGVRAVRSAPTGRFRDHCPARSPSGGTGVGARACDPGTGKRLHHEFARRHAARPRRAAHRPPSRPRAVADALSPPGHPPGTRHAGRPTRRALGAVGGATPCRTAA